jgi:putative membrane protein
MIDYDPHDWFSHLLDLKGSMVREICGRVVACVAWSAAVEMVALRHPVLAIPSAAHSLVGVALGLLLVLRTNASYDRFWEGRKLWGSIVNETRNLARASRVLLREDRDLMRQVVRWTAAFPYAAMLSLRGRDGFGPVALRLPLEEAEYAIDSPHTPLEVAAKITARLASARDRGLISDYVFVYLDNNVQLLIDYIGGCERIRKTPIPFAYMVHLRRALILYTFTLPFALAGEFGWATVLVTALVAYVFYGIEEIGVEIEDPFGEDANDLPLEDICATIEGNILPLIGDVEAATIGVGEWKEAGPRPGPGDGRS